MGSFAVAFSFFSNTHLPTAHYTLFCYNAIAVPTDDLKHDEKR
jgi:hypothetical protein